jgi:hypothetical protein
MNDVCTTSYSAVTRPAKRCRFLIGGMMAVAALAPIVHAQANLSTQGFGYPPGQISAAAQAVGGGTGELDPESALNPAAVGTIIRPTIHVEYDPEFRSVSTPDGTNHTTTIRFPMIVAGLPLTSRFVLGFSFTTLLDRTWESSQTGLSQVGDTLITSTQSFKSTGGIEDIQVAGGWTPFAGLHAGLGVHVYSGQNQITVQDQFPDTTVVKALEFTQNSTYSYVGTGISLGIEARPSPLFAVGGSFEVGGTLRVRRNDTLQSKANVPPRAGAGIQYDGLPGVTFSARAEWEGWSQMGGLGITGLDPHDGWDFGGGVEIVGPKVADRGVALRFGAQTRTLPFLADGALVRENDLAAGLGVPLGGQRAVVDLTLQRAYRTAPLGAGISEAAWLVNLGLTIRP